MHGRKRSEKELTLNIDFVKLTKPTAEIAVAFNQWENDSALIHLIRPNYLDKLMNVVQKYL